MRGRLPAGTVLLLALALAGCATKTAPFPAACSDSPRTITQALQRAPAPVTLDGATKLSTCVSRVRANGDLQGLGSTLLIVADGFRARAASDPVAALRLGYLAGATRRGVSTNQGPAEQIGRRVEQAMLLDGASAGARAALRRGLVAGQAGG